MNQILFKDSYYTFLNFTQFPLIAVFSNRKLDLKNLENQKKFLKNLGISPEELIYLEQIHGDNIIIVKRKDRKRIIPQADALITAEKNTPIAIFTADCLSIFVYDAKRRVIALIHAGRKGTEKEITKKTILKMKREFKTSSKDLWIGLGPAIRDCCYETDLIKLNFTQLISLGVKEKNIFDSGICTSCNNDEFFSYRKEGKSCGRMMSLMMLK